MSAIPFETVGSPHTLPTTRRFYVAMAALFVVIAFTAFIASYWAKVATGTFTGAPILHVHGALFFTWTLFFLAQTTLVASGRTPDHRAWGMAGISLATAMAITIVLAAINSMRVAGAIGMTDEARRFSYVSLTGLVLFAGFMTAAIAWVRRPDLHKRLMILAMIPLMHASVARFFVLLFAPADAQGPPGVRLGAARPGRRPHPRRCDDVRLAHARTAAPGLPDRRRAAPRQPAARRSAQRDADLDGDRGLGAIARGLMR